MNSSQKSPLTIRVICVFLVRRFMLWSIWKIKKNHISLIFSIQYSVVCIIFKLYMIINKIINMYIF